MLSGNVGKLPVFPDGNLSGTGCIRMLGWRTLKGSGLVDGNVLLHQSSAELDRVAQLYPESCGIWREVVVERAGVPPSSAPRLSPLRAVDLGCECSMLPSAFG